MKFAKIKLLLSLMLILSFVIIPNMALATSDLETEIANYIAEQENIVDVKCVVYMRTCVVAIRTEKLTSKRQYDDLKHTLEKELMKKFDIDRAFVTRSPKAMHLIKSFSDMTEEQRHAAISKYIESITEKVK